MANELSKTEIKEIKISQNKIDEFSDEMTNATELIEELVKQQMKVIRFPITVYWIDIGQHSALVKANELVKHLKQ